MNRKRVLIGALAAMLPLTLTGCDSDLVDYITREDPYDAMEEYVEEKYGIEVKVIDTNFDTGYMQAFWHATGYGETVICDELPGQEIGVAAGITENNKYYFYDDYQREYHLKELQQMVTDLLQKYADDSEFYVKVYTKGNFDNQDILMMTMQEYASTYDRYGICLIAREEKSEEVAELAKVIQNELQKQQIRSYWWVGVVPDKIENIKEYVNDDGEFDPWDKAQWLLKKTFDGDWEVQTE